MGSSQKGVVPQPTGDGNASTPGRVLVVDDESTTRSIIKAALQSSNYSVVECTGGQQAVQLIAAEAFDAVLLDILMSDLNGLDVLQTLRQRHPETELPVIMVTVKDSSEDIARAFTLGANDYVVKPIDAKILLARVGGQIARKRAFDELRALNRNLKRRIREREGTALDFQRALKRSEEKFSKTFRASPDPISLSLLEDGRMLDVNESYERATGFRREEVVGRTTTELGLWSPAKRDEFIRMLREQGGVRDWPVVLRNRAGDERSCEVSAEIISVDGTRAIITISRDVTERRRAEEALQASERRYRFLYEDNPSMYFTVDRDFTVKSVNRFGMEQLGYSLEELRGSKLLDLIYTEDEAAAQTFMEACFANPNLVQKQEVRKVCKDGKLIWVKETGRVAQDTDGKESLLLVCHDISETRKLHEQLSYQASHDLLTDLVNRRGLEHRLRWVMNSPELERAEHVLCYLDFDNFGLINQTCGHVAGDTLIRKLAQLMRQHVRNRDTLARIGGDEFAILMEHCSIEPAEKVARALLEKLQNLRFEWNGETYAISASIGISGTEGLGDSEDLLEKAQTACQAAKERGGNRLHTYRDDDLAISMRQQELRWVGRLNRALEGGDFVLYAQPIVAVKEEAHGDMRHFEVLVRMIEADAGTIPPGQFLPAAERYNISPRLDRWVVKTTLAWLVSDRKRLDKIELCSINLSGLSVGEDEFLEFVVRQINESGVPPGKICFEITETAAISDMSSASRFINLLKQHGCRFALDDFGSGLSSFGYLKHLAVDYLKIDGMFVRNIADDPKDFAMVRSINEVGQMMGMQTIAEFVESEAILDRLREIGVDYAQGYAIARPESLPGQRDG